MSFLLSIFFLLKIFHTFGRRGGGSDPSVEFATLFLTGSLIVWNDLTRRVFLTIHFIKVITKCIKRIVIGNGSWPAFWKSLVRRSIKFLSKKATSFLCLCWGTWGCLSVSGSSQATDGIIMRPALGETKYNDQTFKYRTYASILWGFTPSKSHLSSA